MEGHKNYWKVFGIIVMVAAIVAVAFLLGAGRERKKDNDRTTTSTTRTVQLPQAGPSDSSSSGSSASPAQSAGDVGEDQPPAVEDEMPTVVSSKDTVGPCINGFQEVTHTTDYSDGTSASSVSSEPCVEEEEPPIIPVPEG